MARPKVASRKAKARQQKKRRPLYSKSILLSARGVARELQVGERTVWNLVKLGRLPQPIRLSGRLVRWSRSDIEAHLKALSDPRLQ